MSLAWVKSFKFKSNFVKKKTQFPSKAWFLSQSTYIYINYSIYYSIKKTDKHPLIYIKQQSLFVCMYDHNSGNPLTDLHQIFHKELGRTIGMFLAGCKDLKFSGFTFLDKVKFPEKAGFPSQYTNEVLTVYLFPRGSNYIS